MGLRQTFRWICLIAYVRQPIIGGDVLRHFALAVDVRRELIHETETHITVPGVSAKHVQETSVLFRVHLSMERYS